ncbi:annexin A11-like isoform X1 [Dermacentor albipictus]|uniref:annexin A11-like isoform X1 n=1 Tax=Dermacentor albipictus TaxID=60249 RepID=UPI0038FC1F57
MSYGYPQAQHQYQPPPPPGFAPPQQAPPPAYPGYPQPSPAPVAEPYFAASAPVGDTYQPPPPPGPQHLYPTQQQAGGYYMPPAQPTTVARLCSGGHRKLADLTNSFSFKPAQLRQLVGVEMSGGGPLCALIRRAQECVLCSCESVPIRSAARRCHVDIGGNFLCGFRVVRKSAAGQSHHDTVREEPTSSAQPKVVSIIRCLHD